MASLFHILASPRAESFSTRVAAAFLTAYRKAHPRDTVETLDLFKAEIPPFTAPQAKAKYAVLAGQPPRDEAELAWRGVIKVIEHFKKFDKYVVSSPMWNFNIPYRLKQYIDVLVQPALTFAHSPEKGYTGLVTGKPLLLVLASGGAYGSGNPSETSDFQESYLRTIFGFIGFKDIRVVRVQGTLTRKGEQVEAETRRAMDAASGLAVQF
jgi:FMN-dependent NADH-azoreductase